MHRYYDGWVSASYNTDGTFARLEHQVVGRYREHGNAYRLVPRHDLVNHSPDGFSWGYGGSGPAQLALAILADFTGNDELARVWHQTFKDEFIAKLRMDMPFMIEGNDIDAWLNGNEVQIEATMELAPIKR